MNQNKKYLYLLSAGHLSVDINMGSLPALLPFFVSLYGIDYTAAAGLMFATSFIGSLVQPLFGWLADKGSRQWFMAAGVFCAGIAIAVMGFITDYRAIFADSAITGTAVALFHPEAARCVNSISQGERGKDMSIFSVGGNAGFGLGPLLAVFLITTFGMHGLAFYGVLCIVLSLGLMAAAPYLRRAMADNKKAAAGEAAASGSAGETEGEAKNDWSAFGHLFLVIFCRSSIYTGLASFLPLFCIHVLGASEAAGSLTLSVLSIAGIVATLAGGCFADRQGYRKTLLLGLLLLVPCLSVIAFSGSLYAVYAVLLPLSFALLGSYSSFVVLGQEYLAKNIGFASGITIGISMSVGGVVAPALGRFADLYGLSAVMVLLILFAAVGTFMAYLLPQQKG